MLSFRLALTLAAAAALLLPAPGTVAQDSKKKDSAAQESKKDAKLSKQDLQAMTKLAQSDMAEIAAGKVAAQKGSSPEVKKYGQHMVDEHTKMLEEGSRIAQARGVKPPAAPDKKHQAALKKLEAASGEDFDRQFIAQMVKDHEDALKLAEKTAKDAKDPDVKAHAQKGAPHIKAHLEQARKLHASLGASAGAGSKGGDSKKAQ